MAARINTLVLSFVCMLTASCDRGATSEPASHPSPSGLRGHLLVIGGGLDDDNKPVYERFIALARAGGKAEPVRIVIATAASLNEQENATGKIQSIRAYCPTCQVDTIMRETPAAETVTLVDAASAMFFTGGDQKRITTRYLADDKDTPEAAAMRRLLARGGVIAGTSAGDAMMSDPMFFTGRSAEALGIRSTRTAKADDDDDAKTAGEMPLGPQIGKGMGFLPWAIVDSHFFERHRFGRLVAALETSGKRLGIGVGEDACVDVDLAIGEVTGVSVADSLLVDIAGITREGLARRNVRATVIKQGRTISLVDCMKGKPSSPPMRPANVEDVPVVEPGQNRQLASWRFFVAAQAAGAGHNPRRESGAVRAMRLKLDGYDQTAWPDGTGWSVVEIVPQEIRTPDASPRTTTAPRG